MDQRQQEEVDRLKKDPLWSKVVKVLGGLLDDMGGKKKIRVEEFRRMSSLIRLNKKDMMAILDYLERRKLVKRTGGNRIPRTVEVFIRMDGEKEGQRK